MKKKFLKNIQTKNKKIWKSSMNTNIKKFKKIKKNINYICNLIKFIKIGKKLDRKIRKNINKFQINRWQKIGKKI